MSFYRRAQRIPELKGIIWIPVLQLKKLKKRSKEFPTETQKEPVSGAQSAGFQSSNAHSEHVNRGRRQPSTTSMKRWTLLLSLYITSCSLVAWGGRATEKCEAIVAISKIVLFYQIGCDLRNILSPLPRH